MGRYSKYCVCIYTKDGKLESKRCLSCKGCAKKRMPQDKPACVRGGGSKGKIYYKNKAFVEAFE
jgi:hypothetical protein